MKKQRPTTKYDEHKLAVGEVKRHMSALSEEYQSRIDGVVEQFGGMNRHFELLDKKFDLVDRKFDLIEKKFDSLDKKLDSHTEMIARLLEQSQEIKSEMRQKVELQLFAKLEKRVALLESKTHR